MVEGWREPLGDGEIEWAAEESALEPVVRPGVNWPAIAAGLVAGLMTAWLALAVYGFIVDPPRPLADLVPRLALACVPLALGALLLLLIRQSDAAARRRLAVGESLALESVSRLDEAQRHFADGLERDRRAADEQAVHWHALADGLTERTAGLSRQLSDDLAALDGRLERVDAAAAGAKRDLTAVLAGLPKVDRQTRELVGSLREAGLTAHEGAGALDAQLGLLRHRAGEADEVASAATARLAAQLERMETVGQATADQLTGAADEAARAQDVLLERATLSLDRATAALAERAGDMTGTVEGAERRLAEVTDHSGAQLTAQLDLLDERTRGARAAVDAAGGALGEVLGGLDERLARADGRTTGFIERGARGLESLDQGMGRLHETAEATAAQIGAGEEAMSFALGRAESLMTALDAAARELDETLPASFGRFERSAGEGFQRLSDAMPELERYHALTDQASTQLSGLDERLGTLIAALDERLAASDAAVAALAKRVEGLDRTLVTAGDERLPQLTAALQAAHDLAGNLGLLATQAVDEALPPVRERLVDAVSRGLRPHRRRCGRAHARQRGAGHRHRGGRSRHRGLRN